MSGPGDALSISLRTQAGRVAELRVASPRVNVAAVFVGKTPEEAARLAQSLFSLCPMAQSLAARAAGEAARGAVADAPENRLRATRLLCERLGEMLRGSVLDWPDAGAPDADDIGALRAGLQALRALSEGSEPMARLSVIEDSARKLGLREFSGGRTLFARQFGAVRADESAFRLRGDATAFLAPADDGVVADAALRDSDFARAPRLEGRCVETGARARAGASFSPTLAGRLEARFSDMAATLDALGALVHGQQAPDGLVCSGRTDEGAYAAVESARGRLLHALRLDAAGRIAAYAVVAPTEWNFGAHGPYASALQGAEIGEGEPARLRAARLAFVFDPCIRADVRVTEAAHA